ncbi:MAG: methyltransferase domain-containing protein [Chloroflexi bacterium]|nr:methyltransferase domain-containing protein [Chloroflexota bacterium]
MDHQQIITYFETCEIDYRVTWNLEGSSALHLGFWDETTTHLAQALARENEVLAQEVGITSSDRILDAGCGVGGSAVYLAQTYRCHVTGITLVPKQVELARRNALKHGVSDRVTFQIMDFTNTTFADASFDIIWALESVCYSDDKAAFAREAYRLLKPGGKLMLADGFVSRQNLSAEEALLVQQWLNGWSITALETTGNFAHYLQQAGFSSVSVTDRTQSVWPSSRRLYLSFFPGLVITKIWEALGLRNRAQTANVMSCYYQYQALKRKLWHYGVLHAQK